MSIDILLYFAYMALASLICFSALGYFHILIWVLTKFGSKIRLVKALPMSIRLVLGFSVLIFFISYLALASVAYAIALDGLIFVGLACAFKVEIASKGLAVLNKRFFNLSNLIFFSIALLWFSFIVLYSFNIHDDFHAYLTYPKMLLGAGDLYGRAFSERGLYSLGGSSIAQSIFLTHIPFNLVRIFEAVCAVLALRLSWDLSRHFKQRNIFFPTCGLLLLFCMDKPFSNSSSFFSSTLWIISGIYLTYLFFRFKILSNHFLIPSLTAFITTILLSYKHVNIPTSFFIFFSLFIIFLINIRRLSKILKFVLVQSSIVFIVLIPFLIINFVTYATPFFPFLGKGNHRFSYTDQPSIVWAPNWVDLHNFVTVHFDNHWRINLTLALIIFALVRIYFAPKNVSRKFIHYSAFLLGLGFAILVIRYLLAYRAYGDAIRHLYPIELAFFLLVIPISHHLLKLNGKIIGIVATVFIMFPKALFQRVGNQIIVTATETYHIVYDIVLVETFKKVVAFRSQDSFEADKATAEVQNKIPKDEKVFLFVSKPFLFDYSRNKIFACDSGAMVSPYPHIPYGKPSQQLIEYFRKRGIKYLVYSKDEIDYSRATFKDRLTTENILIQWYTLLVFDLINQFEDLVKNKRYAFQNEKYYLFRIQ